MTFMKTDILLLHGALLSSSSMGPFAALLESNYGVHVFNFPGHGGREFSTQPLSMNLLVKDVNEYVQQKNLNGCIVFGYSMGGYAALKVEAEYPGTFQSIITLGTKFNWDKQTVSEQVSKLDPDTVKTKVPAFAAQLKEMHGDSWSRLLNETAGLMNGLSPEYISDKELNSIKCNVMLCVGDQDQMVTIDETKLIASKIKNAAVKILPATPHQFSKVDLTILAQVISESITNNNAG